MTIEAMKLALEALEDARDNHGLHYVNEIVDLRQAIEQAEQAQPFAEVRLNMTGGNAGLSTHIVQLAEGYYPAGTKLYTAPPPRQPLTDEQISDLWCKVSNTDFVTADTHEFARAIEAAHGIKGEA